MKPTHTQELKMTGAKASLRALGIHVPDILVPKHTCDLKRWAVVPAISTRQSPNMAEVDDFVKDAPSSLRLYFLKYTLIKSNLNVVSQRLMQPCIHISNEICSIPMKKVFSLFIERLIKTPDVGDCSSHLILSRWLRQGFENFDTRDRRDHSEPYPAEKEIRKDALLELPHILVLIDDVQKTVIEPLILMHEQLPKVYETELMMGGGTVQAYRVQRKKCYRKSHEHSIIYLTGLIRKIHYCSLWETGIILSPQRNHVGKTRKWLWAMRREKTTLPASHYRDWKISMIRRWSSSLSTGYCSIWITSSFQSAAPSLFFI